MTPYSWFGRVVQSLVVGALVAAASLWGAWSLFDVVWQSSQSLRENVSAFVMIPLVGLGIFIPPLVVLLLCLRLGAFVTILMWPKKVVGQGVAKVQATRVPTADAVADALAQHRKGIRVTATCPSCGVGITVERSGARVAAADAKIYLRCACGACGGQFPA
jgi:hypothetical protein